MSWLTMRKIYYTTHICTIYFISPLILYKKRIPILRVVGTLPLVHDVER
jgi:hypothetical protein